MIGWLDLAAFGSFTMPGFVHFAHFVQLLRCLRCRFFPSFFPLRFTARSSEMLSRHASTGMEPNPRPEQFKSFTSILKLGVTKVPFFDAFHIAFHIAP